MGKHANFETLCYVASGDADIESRMFLRKQKSQMTSINISIG